MLRGQEETQAYFIDRFSEQAMGFSAFMEEIKEDPEHTVFCYQRNNEEHRISWSQWERDVYACATWMKKQGLAGQHIAVAVQNCYEWFVIVFGAGISGNVAVSLNPGLPVEDLEKQMRQADASLLLLREEDGIAVEGLECAGFRILQIMHVVDAIKAMPEDEICRHFESDPEKLSLILFSSGTSGLPKGVMLSQKNLLSPIRRAYGALTETGYLCLLPLSHISGIWSSLIHMAMGSRVCICESAKYFVRDFKRFEPGVLAVVPMQLDFIAAQCRRNAALRAQFQRCVKEVYCLGASLNRTYEELFDQTDILLLNGYGMTETSGMITAMKPVKAGALGRMSDMYEYRIKDGELQIRAAKYMQGKETKGSTIMLGYYRNEDATRELYDEGWLCTGDLVREDDEGFLFLIGRKKNVIILANGENVNPEVLENRIHSYELAKEVIVLEHMQKIAAKVYLGERDSDEAREAFLKRIEEMNKELPMIHRIQQVLFTAEPLPRNANGKIARARCSI